MTVVVVVIVVGLGEALESGGWALEWDGEPLRIGGPPL